MSASPETLVKHAGWTAGMYMAAAVEEIDKQFGKDYARNTPELVGAFMQTSAIDFLAAYLAQEIREEIRLHS